MPNWVHGVGLGGSLGVLLVFAILFVVFRDVAVWADWLPADEFVKPEYGERIYPDSVFRTRMNTWSNIFYVLCGFYAIGFAINDYKQRLTLQRGYLAHTPAISVVFGLAAIYSGLGSGFFHASLTRYGQQLDVGAMYAMTLCLAAIAIGSWLPRFEIPWLRRTYPSWPLIVLAVVVGSVYFTYYKWEYEFGAISACSSGVLFIFAMVSLVQPGKYLQIRWFVAAIASILLASNIRTMDIQGNFTDPDSLFQGHAVWHFASSLYYFFLYLYFRSEERAVVIQE